MRPLEFRGIRKYNGEFIYGSLSMGGSKINEPFDKDLTYIEPSTEVLIRYEVDPETVGQFTGRRDGKRTEEYPEGQKIWEGDKISDGAGLVMSIFWHEESAGFYKGPVGDESMNYATGMRNMRLWEVI